MARHRYLLLVVGFCGWAFSAAAETPAEPVASPVEEKAAEKTADSDDWNVRRQQFREMREKLEKLPPDQRKKALESFRELREMSPDEQAHFRFIQQEREKRVKEAVDETLRLSGLQLNDAQKEEFTKIYRQERRKLEQELRAEMDQRRKERMPDFQKSVAEAYAKATAEKTPAVEK